MNTSQEKIRNLFNEKIEILLTTHIRPDADAIGSTLALYHFLKAKGHNVNVVFPSPYADYYDWFPGIQDSFIFQKSRLKVRKLIKKANLIIAIDFNSLKRNGDLGKELAENNIPKFLIDHHPDPEDNYDYKLWDVSYCAAAEGVFDLIEMLDSSYFTDKTIASCLYGALIADSGSFSYPSVTSKTFRIAGTLVESGIDHSLIQKEIFNNFSENRFLFWAYCIKEKITVIADKKLAYLTVTLDEMNQFNVKPADTENLVNFSMIMKDINVSALFIERENDVKISLRSKNDFPVNKLAQECFNGGGHQNAAGGEVKLQLNEAIELLIKNVSF